MAELQGLPSVESSERSDGQQIVHFLPKVSGAKQSRKSSLEESPAFRAMAKAMQMHAPANVAPLQSLLRERDLEILRLKHENALLKQIERRQQKDLQQLEWQSEEKVIRALRDEVAGLKHKLKIYFTQLSANAREMRHISEDRRRLKSQNARLEKLTAEKQLAERDQLSREVETLLKRLHEQEKITSDAIKKAELTEKNLNIDNRHLRSRIHILERDNAEHLERIQRLDDVIKDKDKAISSLLIYRYNAVHRKIDNVCKTCQQREKDDEERKKFAENAVKLPKLESPIIVSLSTTAVEAKVRLPKADGELPYSRLTLIYSSDSHMKDDVLKKVMTITQEDALPNAENTVSIETNHAEEARGSAGSESEHVEMGKHKRTHKKRKAPQSRANADIVRSFVIDGLVPGKEYFFAVTCGRDDIDIDGPVSTIAKIFLEAAAASEHVAHRKCPPQKEFTLAEPPKITGKPEIKPLTRSSVLLSCMCASAPGLPVETLRIITLKKSLNSGSDDNEGKQDIEKSVSTSAEVKTSTDSDHLSHIVDGLEPSNCYYFEVQASNSVGWSEVSCRSEGFTVAPIPSTTIPKTKIAHSHAVSHAAAVPLPPSPPPASPIPPSPLPASTLPITTSVTHVEEDPKTPVDEPARPDNASPEPPEPVPLESGTKTTSNLTLNQRIANMHHGLAAYHEPAVIP